MDIKKIEDNEGAQDTSRASFRLSEERFFIFSLYLGAIFIGYCLNFTFPAMIPTLKDLYHASNAIIVAINNMLFVFEFILNIPILFVIERVGTRNSMILGTLGLTLGSMIRCLVPHGMVFAFLGQAFIGISYQIIQPLGAKIATLWFPEEQHVRLFSMTSIFYSLGASFGFFLPTVIFSSGERRPDQKQMELLIVMFITMVLALFVFLMNIIYFKDSPDVPISKKSLLPREKLLVSLKMLWVNKNFKNLTISSSIFLSGFFLRISSLYYILHPFGYSEKEISATGSFAGISEMLGHLFLGFVLSKYVTQEGILTLKAFLCLVVLVVLVVSLYTYVAFLTKLAICLLGFISCWVWTPTQIIAMKVAFPVDEVNSVGIIFTFSCVTQVITSGIFAGVYELNETYWSPVTIGFLMLTFGVALYMYIFLERSINAKDSSRESLIELQNKN